MTTTSARLTLAVAFGVAASLFWFGPPQWKGRERSRMDSLPPRTLWAWERAEDLHFIDPESTAVAFLSRAVLIRDGGVELRPRLQPLRVPPGTQLIAVTRIETTPGSAGKLDSVALHELARAIAVTARMPGVRAVQVDYDARVSDRLFYRALLTELRNTLPLETPLSITALASWCLGDNWLAGLPIDEAVPMLFQMGPESTAIRLHLKTGGDFSAPLCRGSLGLATNEPVPHVPARRRIYLWNPQAWSKDAALERTSGGLR